MENELPDELYEQLKALCRDGDQYCENGEYKQAVVAYRDAWNLIPDPKVDWNASTWVLTAIADAYLFNGDFDYAKESLDYAMHCPNGLGNPYIHLRLGQANFEVGDLERAADELARANMGAGESIFEGQDAKYLEFLKTKMII